jgi:VWFA-related protein
MRVSLFVAVGAAITIAACASSQRSAPTEISPPLNLCMAVDAPTVQVAEEPGYVQYAVTVTDAAGKPVRGLMQSDFAVHAGNQTLPIKYFREAKGDAPESIVLVVDESASMRKKLGVWSSKELGEVRDKMTASISGLNRCDEIATVVVGGYTPGEQNDSNQAIRLLEPFTTDHDLALIRIFGEIASGPTPLVDGIDYGLQLSETSFYPNRTMIVITDGLEATSRTPADTVLHRAREDEVPIYVIGPGDPTVPEGRYVMIGPFTLGKGDADRVDERSPQLLSTQTGGQYMIVPPLAKDSGSGFAGAIGKLENTLGYGYSIGAIASASEARSVTIALASAGANRLRARKEYLPLLERRATR